MKNNVQVIMNDFYIIEIFKVKRNFDVFGEEIKKSIEELGIKGVKEVRVSNLYKIEGEKINRKICEKIAEELFIDNVSEDFDVYKRKRKKKNFFEIEVYFKEGVADPVGDTAKRVIVESGILKDVSVKTGKKYYIKGKISLKEIEEICEKILVNNLIHNYFIKWKK